jgi:prepilin peptidase CpaA
MFLPNWNTVMQASLLAMLLVASWQDMAFRIVSNRLVLMGAVLGLSFSALPAGQGFGSALASSLVLFLSFFVLYLAGWLGAGDVKLAGATGAYFSADQALELGLIIMITGGLVCLAWSLWKSPQDRKGIPYALCICVGVFFYLWAKN